MKQYHVGILLFNYVDALDFVGPYEVFNMSTFQDEDVDKLYMNKLSERQKPFLVSTISEDGKEITVHNGLKVIPDFSFKEAPTFDIILVPGGPYNAIESVYRNERIIDWISSQKDKLVLSVCTGALFLAKAGLLDGKKATTNRAALRLMRKSYPEVEVIEGQKFVDQGDIVTAAGISAGINMAIYVVGKLINKEAANRVMQTIEFNIENEVK